MLGHSKLTAATTSALLCGAAILALLVVARPTHLALPDSGMSGSGASPDRAATPDRGCRDRQLGVATAFNLFLLGDLEQRGSDTEGRVAVGGKATLTDYSVGAALPPGTLDETLIVGGALTIQHGAIATGSAVSGESATLENISFAPNSGYRRALPLDFVDAARNLRDISTAYGSVAPSGATGLEYSRLLLEGTASDLNVFTVRAADLAAASTIAVRVPAGSTVLVNVSGEDVSLENLGFDLAGLGADKILYNFPAAKHLLLRGVGIQGSILAPWASIDFQNGAIKGTLIATSLTGPGQMNQLAFSGCIAPNPTR